MAFTVPRPNTNDFIIQSLEDEKVIFRAYFGDGAALVTDGYGGWEVQGRTKNIGVTEWAGRNPIAVEIPFVIDNHSFVEAVPGQAQWPSELSRCEATETQVTTLGHFCGLGESDQPPLLRVDGGGAIPHDDTYAPDAHMWVIESVTWDRDLEIRSGVHAKRLRCGGMMVIRQYKSTNDLLRRLGPRNRARKPEIYTVKLKNGKPETLQEIAKKKYKNPNRWKIIADANHLRDPRHLKQGQKLRIPR